MQINVNENEHTGLSSHHGTVSSYTNEMNNGGSSKMIQESNVKAQAQVNPSIKNNMFGNPAKK